MLGRLIGIVFLIPFLWFWLRGYVNGPLIRRVLALFGLGGLQGLMGWYMVKSGLVDRAEVSHYRLAAHLMLAVTIFSCCVWFANDLLARPRRPVSPGAWRSLVLGLTGIGTLLIIQIFWGALVAGLNAGFSFGTFPLMNGSLLPPRGWALDPVLINLVENPATVQWMHRVLATLLLAGAISLAVTVRRDAGLAHFRHGTAALAGLILMQYALGVSTLRTHVETGIAVAHQATALLIVGVMLTLLHGTLRSSSASLAPAQRSRG